MPTTTYAVNDVNAWFQAIQYRNGPDAQVNALVSGLNAGVFTAQSVQNQIINDEYTTKYVDPVIYLYKAVLGRNPDHDGAQNFIAALASNPSTLNQIADELSRSTEAAARFDSSSDAALIQTLFQNVLGRAPAPAETIYYQNALSSGVSRAAVINGFAQSPEFTSTHAQEIAQFHALQIVSATSGTTASPTTPTQPTYTAADINGWYQSIQFRDGPVATVSSFVALLNNHTMTAQQVQQSIVSDSFCANYVNPIVRLYQAAFNRVPDNDGQNRWVDLAASGDSLQNIANGFANSPEFLALYGVNASAPINAALLTGFYQNILGRAPDAAGYGYWLNSGLTVGQVLNQFAQSSEFILKSSELVANFQAAQLQHTVPGYAVPLGYFATSHQDTTAPTATVVAATIAPSGGAVVQSSEVGGAYLVRDTVNVTNVASILGAGDQNFNAVAIASANKNTNLSATGLVDGVYKVYTVDASGNLSAAAANLVTVDATAPTLSSSTPSDNATGVAVGANIVLAFTEAVKAGTGNIQIFNADTGALVETIAANGSRVQFNGSAVTINPMANLAQGTSYYVKVDNAAITDMAGNAYAGITNPAALNFRTANAAPAPALDTTAPTLSSSSPLDNATAVAVGSNLVLTFSEAVQAGTGNIVIKKASDNSLVTSIAVTDSSQVSISGTGVTINPTSDLSGSTEYYVQIDNGAITDTSGNAYAGISSSTALSFTTVTLAPPVITVAPTAASATTISLTSNEAGTAQLYVGATPIGSSAPLTANVSGSITVAAQSVATQASIVVTSNATGLTTTSSVTALLGTAGNDTLTGDGNANLIFGFDGVNTVTGGGGVDVFVIPTRYFMDFLSQTSITDLAFNNESDVVLNYSMVNATLQGNWVATSATKNFGNFGYFNIYADGTESVDLSQIVATGGADGFYVTSSGSGSVIGSLYRDYLTLDGATAVFTGAGGADSFVVKNNAVLTVTDLGNGADSLYQNVSETGTINATVVADWVATSATVYAGAGQINLTSGSAGVDIDVSGASTYNSKGWVITGSTGNEVLVGDNYADTITGGAGADDMTGGDGNDTFVIGNTDSGATTATADIIRGFATGTDKLDLNTAGTVSNFTPYDSNTMEDVVTVEDAVSAANGFYSAGAVYQFIYDSVGGTAGYLCADFNNDGNTDLVVKLAGVNSAIAFGDII